MAAPPRPALVALPLAWAILMPGCAWAPRSRVEEARQTVQALRAENVQMKDTTLALRVQNQDLAQRAVDDARAIRALEVANDQYERSIQGYQTEREQMRSAFRDVERQARGGSRPDLGSAANPDDHRGRSHDLARAIPGGSYDDATDTLTVPADALFPRGGSRPTADGDAWLDALAVAVAASDDGRVALVLVGPAADASVRRASLVGDDPAKALAEKRARVVRDAVAARARVDAGRVKVTTKAQP